MSQSLNRYSYVLNNPLSMIDPSGFNFLSSAFHAIGHFLSKYWRMIAAVIIAIYAPELLTAFLGEFGAAVATGMLAGGVATGTWKGALIGGITGALFYGAGQLSTIRGWDSGSIQSSFTHAVAGCASASIGGGSCGRGALAAGFADYYRGQLAANNTASNSNFLDSIERGATSGENTTLDGGTFSRAFYEARAAVTAYVMGQSASESKTRSLYLVAELPNNDSAYGHAFIGGFRVDGELEAWGFYPKEHDWTALVYGVGGSSVQDDTNLLRKALAGDMHFQVREFAVTTTQYNAAIGYMHRSAYTDYAVGSRNCVNTAMDALYKAGVINIPMPFTSPSLLYYAIGASQ